MVQVVILAANGEFKVGKVGAKPSASAISKALRKTKIPDFEGSYAWKDKMISIWGWKEGKAGTENKHELPPPHDNILLFGDVIAAVPKGDFTIEDWKAFYNAAFKGFEDLGSEDSDNEEEDEEGDDEFEDDGEEAVEEADESEAVSEGEDVEEEGDADGSATDDEEADEEEADDECYDSDEGAGGGRRRTQRRRTTAAPEYRRMDMGLRSRIKIPNQLGKRAPRWQTAAELEPEGY